MQTRDAKRAEDGLDIMMQRSTVKDLGTGNSRVPRKGWPDCASGALKGKD